MPIPKSPPVAPTTLVATALQTPDRVLLTWTDTSSEETRVILQRCTGVDCTGFVTLVTLARNTTGYTDSSITQGATYRYRIQASNSYGNSPWSNVATVGILQAPPAALPAAPTNLIATPQDGSVDLTWTASPDATTYTVKRGAASGSESVYVVGVTGTSYSDTAVVNGTRYFYTLLSVGAAGTSLPSNEVSVVPVAPPPASPPPAPTNLTATPGDGFVDLAWGFSVGALSYTVKRGLENPPSTKLPIQTGITDLTFHDATVTNGIEYAYVVVAVNGAGTSAHSNERLATPTAGPAPPPSLAAPTGLTATPGNARVTLSWSAVSGANSYTIRRGTTSGGETTLVAGQTALSYVDSAVVNGTQYFYVVVAVSATQTSPDSTEVSAVPVAATPPLAPQNLVASPGIVRVDLTWSLAVGVTYKVKRGLTAGSEVTIASGLTNANYADTSVVGGTRYYYVVTAISTSTGLESGTSNEVSAIPTAVITPPPPPPPPPPSGNIINVYAGGSLQSALNAAQPGDSIRLENGATFVGNFTWPIKSGSNYITIQPMNEGNLTPAGTRTNKTLAGFMPKIVTANTAPAITSIANTRFWRLQNIEVFHSFISQTGTVYNLILLGTLDGSTEATSTGQLPTDIIFDRCYIHGDPNGNCRRGIAQNAIRSNTIDCYISEIHEIGADSQAIDIWNGLGPFLINNNYLEAACENIQIGGADAAIPNLTPSNITFTNNYCFKPLSWMGGIWSVKNIFELKNAQDVLVEHNTFENIWVAGQNGFAIVFTNRNQSGTNPWTIVQRVTFKNNRIKNVANCFNITGYDNNYESLQSNNIRCTNNLVTGLGFGISGPAGRLAQISNGPVTVVIDHNTAVPIISGGGNMYLAGSFGPTSWLPAGAPQTAGLVFTNNLMKKRNYGVVGDSIGEGTAALNLYTVGGYTFTKNVLATNDGSAPALYTGSAAGNLFPTDAAFDASFINPSGGNYGLVPSSPYKNAGTDGKDIGCDVTLIP